MSATTPPPVMVHQAQADELRQLLVGVLGWLVDGDPTAHDDLACHLAEVAARAGGPLRVAGGDTLALFESFLDVYTATISDTPPWPPPSPSTRCSSKQKPPAGTDQRSSPAAATRQPNPVRRTPDTWAGIDERTNGHRHRPASTFSRASSQRRNAEVRVVVGLRWRRPTGRRSR